VIDRGRIVEEGNHQELLARRGAYSRFYGQQFREEFRIEAT
jgi:ABC-type multidrug transport system fused ATPase/permease subunit